MEEVLKLKSGEYDPNEEEMKTTILSEASHDHSSTTEVDSESTAALKKKMKKQSEFKSKSWA